MSAWQPIETAPKDGSWFLLFDKGNTPSVMVARWSADHRPSGPLGPFVWELGSPGHSERMAESVPTLWAPIEFPEVQP